MGFVHDDCCSRGLVHPVAHSPGLAGDCAIARGVTMTHKTLFCTVGRATPRPVATVDDDAADQEATLAAIRDGHRLSLIAGGVSPDRISFHTEAGGEEAKPKKGKG